MLHLQIFSPILWVIFFILFMVSFTLKKLLSLLRYHLFCFYLHYSSRWIKKDTTVSESVLFSSMSLGASSLIVRSLIHFEFIFVYGVRECSNFILLHVAVQFTFYAYFLESFYHKCNTLFLRQPIITRGVLSLQQVTNPTFSTRGVFLVVFGQRIFYMLVDYLVMSTLDDKYELYLLNAGHAY